jgi:ubiquinol-cytochrome c reductase iron-sulfur subunit
MNERRKARAGRSGLVNFCFALSALASVGLMVVYIRGGQPQAEGALLLVALGGIAFGLIVWAHRFLPHGPHVQAREPLPSSASERQAFATSFDRGGKPIGRRSFLVKMLGLSLAALGAAALFPIRSLGRAPSRALFRTAWRKGSKLVRTDGTPVTVSSLAEGGILTVFPEGAEGSADSQTVLIRLAPGELHVQPGRETWSPEGYVAYSKLCTHAGCPVGLYEQRTQQLFCPCHQSVFDVLDAARPTAGPATRPLPQLPLEVDADGILRAQADYDEPVGLWFWNAGD